MNFETKAALVGALPRPLRQPLMRFYYRREVSGRGEAELMQIGRLLPDGGTALDVGAHIGVYSYALSQAAGRVIAFEPDPLMARFLRGLKLDRVEVREIALSSRDGEEDLVVPDGGAGLGTLRHEGVGHVERRQSVHTSRLDTLALTDVAFVKIDVEGYEEEVLAGATETIRKHQPAFLIEIEERWNPGGLARIVASLGDHGYTAHFFDRSNWRPLGELEAGAGHSHINNFLFLPPARPIAGINA